MNPVIIALVLLQGTDVSESLRSDVQSPLQAPDVQLLMQGDALERMDAAKRLGEVKDRSAVGPLIQNLNHPNQYVRGQVAWALGEIGDPAAIAPLEQAIAKYDAMVPRFDRPVQGQMHGQWDGFFGEVRCLEQMRPALRKLKAKRIALLIQSLLF